MSEQEFVFGKFLKERRASLRFTVAQLAANRVQKYQQGNSQDRRH